ncbi:MAG: thiamine pyrophosphate-binding protein [Acidobacteria bacterium]|nr:thiamine pyrophosphate-binding protein [Acidobacteriota bacterium]
MSTTISTNTNAVATPPGTRIAAYQLTEYLERIGVEVIFGLCGHTIIALLHALSQSKIKFIGTRHEQLAAHAAEGYARATGKVGVMLCHLGPGLTNAVTGVANAALDSTPMVVIAGDVPSHYFGRHAHQEVQMHADGDQSQIYRPFCKRVYRVDRPQDLPRIIERAFHLAQTGRKGPVLVDVPMDVFSADLPVGAFNKAPAPMTRPMIDADTTAGIVDALANAARPVLYAGGGVLSSRATAELATLAEALEIPVAHSLMGKGCLPHDHPFLMGMTGYWGTPLSNEKCRTADLIVAIGTRFGECNSSSWYTDYTFQMPPTRLIHIDADPAEIGRNYPTELGVVADAKLALTALAKAAKGQTHKDRGSLRTEIAKARAEYVARFAAQWESDQFPMRPERILSELRKALPEDGIIVTDVGWNKNGLAQQFPISIPGTFITTSGLATMGFGPAAALGVKCALPNRPVVALTGDGGFGANPSVIATAMEANIPVVWLVMDNAQFGVIAGLEKGQYDTTFGCVFLRNDESYRVDWAQVAKGYGAEGMYLQSADELGPALKKALASGLPTVIQAPMENVPTPTPGYWNIHDIYRKGC